jgi:ATP-dependent DNA helicase RecQ
VHYAEISACRRAALLEYFGEIVAEENCGGCDNCLAPRDTYDGTLPAQKFLSCVYRIRQRSGFGVGVNHVVEVLTGAETERIRKWKHQELSTYGIGKDQSRPEWQAVGRELIRAGYLKQLADKYSVLELTPAGMAVLKERKQVTLTRPMVAPQGPARRAGEITCDEGLFERLRQLRRRLADERSVPSYIVFSDVALRQMARVYPADEREFARISGVGEKKLQEFGSVFLGEIRAHLEANPRQVFAEDLLVASSEPKPRLGGTALTTLQLFRKGSTVEQIAAERGLVTGTIYGHLALAIESGEPIEVDRFLTREEQAEVEAAFSRCGWANLVGAHEVLAGRFDHGKLRLFRASRGPRASSPAAAAANRAVKI